MTNGRQKIEEADTLIGELMGELSKFPAKPRGKLPGLADATREANSALTSGGIAKLQSAIMRVRKIANGAGYFDPVENDRLKNHPPEILVCGDAPPELGDFVVKKGRGNRTNIQRQNDFVIAFSEIKAAGLPLPVDTIKKEHLLIDSFTDALDKWRYLTRAGLTRQNVGTEDYEQRRRLRNVARDALTHAAEAFSNK